MMENAHWNGLERNGTLEHPTVPAAGAGPPGPPQPLAACSSHTRFRTKTHAPGWREIGQRRPPISQGQC